MSEGDDRVLKFTIAEMRGILLATRYAPRPVGLNEAKIELEQQIECEWRRQQREAPKGQRPEIPFRLPNTP